MLFFTVGIRSGTLQSAVDLTDPQLQSMTTRSGRRYTHEQFGGGRNARRTIKHRGSWRSLIKAEQQWRWSEEKNVGDDNTNLDAHRKLAVAARGGGRRRSRAERARDEAGSRGDARVGGDDEAADRELRKGPVACSPWRGLGES